MPYLVILPVSGFIFIFGALLKNRPGERRLAFLWAAILWGIAAVGLTEILSGGRILTLPGVAAGWMIVSSMALGHWIFFPKSSEVKVFSPSQFSPEEILALVLGSGIVLIVGLNAILAAPNNWDSMTYHLPRIMHWIQNQSVEHYPTPILRQLYQPPGAEFLILQFQILTQGDHFANLIQWASMIGGGIVLSLIAAQLGAGQTGQILTALLSLTVPMGILQGSSTQNDYVVGFWLGCFIYFTLRLWKSGGQAYRRSEIFGAGLTLGLAFLTKGSAYIYAMPWLLGFCWIVISRKKRNLIRDFGMILLICLMVNAGFYGRNIKLFGAPLSVGTEDYVNHGGILRNGLSNVVRNAALHWGTPLPAVNGFIKEKILAFRPFGGGAESNSWGDFDIPPPSTNEDIAGNPFHFLLILIVFLSVLFSRGSAWILRNYVLLIVAAFIFFCTLLKWQLFHSRLHLPLFLLSLPVAGLILEKMRFTWLRVLITSVLVLAAVPPLFLNERHPLVGRKNIFNMSRSEQYFSYRKFMALPYVLSVKYAGARSTSDVGLLLGGDDWEYPLWILLKKDNPNVHIWHRGVKNVSGSLEGGSERNISLVISELADAPTTQTLNGKGYLKSKQFSFMSIYENVRP